MNIQPPSADRGSFPDWLILALGAIFAGLGFAIADIPTVAGVAAGLLVIAVAVWDMWIPSVFSAVAEAAAGLVVFLLPWFAGFAGSSASWLAWVFSVLIVLAAAWSWAAHPTTPTR